MLHAFPGGMLRINGKARDGGIDLELEGMIASEWMRTLESECRRWLGLGLRVRLDFHGVTYVDGAGARLVRRLQEEGVVLIRCSDLMREVLLA